MGTHELARATRRSTRRRVVGTGATCERCGWTDPVALTRTDARVLCYECRCAEGGTTPTEQHHHLGRAVDAATIPIPGNIHRDLSDRQRDWPAGVRTNPQRDPVLWLAAALLGLRDHLAWWVSWLDRIADGLIALGDRLRAHHGERWWEALGVDPVWRDAAS